MQKRGSTANFTLLEASNGITRLYFRPPHVQKFTVQRYKPMTHSRNFSFLWILSHCLFQLNNFLYVGRTHTKVFQNRRLRRILGPRWEEVTEGW
jgi:hypothetical protein